MIASSLRKKYALSVSTNIPLSNGSSQLHKTMEEKSKEKSLKDTAMSYDTWLLLNQKDKPKSECLNYFKVVDIINEYFRSTLNPSTVRLYVKQGHIGCGQLNRGPHGTVVDNVTYPILLRYYITHCQILQANSRKEPNLKDLVTLTKLAVNIENRSNVNRFI